MISHWVIVRRRIFRMVPFLVAMFAAFAFVALPPDSERTAHLGAVFGISALVTTAAVLVPWDRLPRIVQVLPAMGYLPAIALLRDIEGGPPSGYAPLVVLPVLWLALYGTGGAVAISVAGVAAALIAPLVLVGDPRYPSSEWRWTGVTVTVAAVAGYTVFMLVARSKKLTARLAELARTDPLTLLANRRRWDEELARETARSRRTGAPLAVALLDLDGLKGFNDRFGHLAGDALLQDSARAWSRETRTEDLLARYGGDEFGLILPGCTLESATGVVERLRAATPGTTCSVGVAEWRPGETEDALLTRADAALYAAKRAGRGRLVTADAVRLQPALG